MPDWITWLMVLWFLFMVWFLGTGGYFMFRKFLKAMPKEDGKSDLDWQDHYIERTRHLWTEEQKSLLEELVQPVPKPFRDTAMRTIAGKIGQLAVQEKADAMSRDLIIRGYIMATPKRDHQWLVQTLQKKEIDLQPYQGLLK
ncbi:DUF2621 family protein [Desmospora activa]|uniref:Uncharacterized protein DUF2621 n=1 Tax=Desmospora activa DSM 45169 TaxID=1121389 RepID=A0A2T4Z0Q4_9BACL|nr:DUF2621 family protein [Desmospora activa]PTM53313.1 uncharacterized protein DUF2621 [Desmospora activa DSM 45169]